MYRFVALASHNTQQPLSGKVCYDTTNINSHSAAANSFNLICQRQTRFQKINAKIIIIADTVIGSKRFIVRATNFSRCPG